MAEPPTAMDKGAMKRLLARSKEEPVSCALALSEDGKSAVLLLDKIKQPRAMQQVLQKDHPKATNPRFGTAEVNEEIDAKLVRFHLNRAAPGMARRLVRTLKGTGYGKVEIVLEDGSVAEKAGAEEDEQDAETTPGDAPTPPAAHHDAGQLTRALKALAERIAGVTDHDERTALVKLAAQGQAALKAGDLAAAEAAILELNKEEAALAKTQPHAPAPKLQPIWQAAKESVDAKLEALARQLRSLEDEDADQVAEFGLFGVTGGRETVGVMAALAAYDGTTPEKRDAAAAAVLKALAAYRQVLDTNPMAELLDDNPFGVEVGLQTALGGALRQIEAVLA